MACEKCEIWQHVDCLPNSRDKEELLKRKDVPEGTYPEYEFICSRCKKKAKEASKADGAKTKEQLRKERERELNRAKYARRKEREKARKEEQRKREEEQRLGLSNGQVAGSPKGEIYVLGTSSSPAPLSSSPDRTPITIGKLSPLPQYHPPNQYSNATMSHPQQQGPQPSQNSIPSPQIRYVQHQQGAIPTPNFSFTHSNQPTPSQQQTGDPHLSQTQPPQQSPQYQPVRPPIQPYWSPYTTSPTLPNGQTFTNSRPHSAPYANGFVPPVAQVRTIASKPSSNTQYQPQSGGYAPQIQQQTAQYPTTRAPPSTPSHLSSSKSPELQRSALPRTQPNAYSSQQHAQHLSQSPAIQPRPSKSPENQRSSVPNAQKTQQTLYPSPQGPPYSHHLPAIQPRPSNSPELQRSSPPNASQYLNSGQINKKTLPAMPSPLNQPLPSPMDARNVTLSWSPGVQQNRSTPATPVGQLQSQVQQDHMQEMPVNEAVTSPRQRYENQNGLGNGPEKPILAASTPAVVAQSTPAKSGVSGAVENDSDVDANTLSKENERTKMWFLLN